MIEESVKNTLDRIVATVGDLPAAPAVMSAAMAYTSNLESNTSDIGRVLSSDQSLTAKVLRIANSPFYGRIKEVQTIHDAILILGFKTLRSIIVASSAHTMFSDGDIKELQTKLWKHSLSAAIAGRQIAKHLNHPECEEIFIAALLHDIGKLVLMQKVPEWYQKVVDEVEKVNCSFSRVETRVFHFDHMDVASLLLAEWAFPGSLVRAIALHHRPPSFRLGGAVPIAHVVNLANYMAKRPSIGFNDEKIESLERLDSAQAMGLHKEKLDIICEEFRKLYKSEARIFESY